MEFPTFMCFLRSIFTKVFQPLKKTHFRPWIHWRTRHGEATPLATKLDEDGEGGVLPLDQLLPMGRVSPFHCFFINFCINNETRRRDPRFSGKPWDWGWDFVDLGWLDHVDLPYLPRSQDLPALLLCWPEIMCLPGTGRCLLISQESVDHLHISPSYTTSIKKRIIDIYGYYVDKSIRNVYSYKDKQRI